MFSNTIRALSLTIATLGVSVISSPTLAENPDNPAPKIAQHCVETMQDITDTTRGVINVRRAHTVDVIRTLDQNGAPDVVLIGAAAEGRQRVNQAAAQGAQAINTLTGECLQALHQIEAPLPLIRSVQFARQGSLIVIGHARDNATDRINQALANALHDTPPQPAPTG